MAHFFKFYVAIIGRTEEAELQIFFKHGGKYYLQGGDLCKNDLSIPEGQAHRRRCAFSPTFATGKLNEPMAPRNGNENTGNSTQESEEPKK